MLKISVLGAGLVGSAIAIDLNKKFDVSVYDINAGRLQFLTKEHGLKVQTADLSVASEIHRAVAQADIVVNALPGFMGFNTLKEIILAGKNVVDISFSPEDAFELDELAKEKGVTAIVDCGVAPGMGNILCGYHNARMEMTDYKCYVGGLPFRRQWPFQYKAVFSPIDVIEEYTRPARFVQNGQVVVRPALSDVELVNFAPVGTLEAFNTDGLRTLIKTMNIPNMVEKTLRYPGTAEYMMVLRETGLFDTQEIEVKGTKIRPVDVAAQLLFPKWKLDPKEKEFTIMRVMCRGSEQGKEVEYVYDLFDVTDTQAGTTSMARTTGYTCTAAVNLVAVGLYTQKGISPPEYIATTQENFEFIMNYLAQRNVNYRVKKQEINQ